MIRFATCLLLGLTAALWGALAPAQDLDEGVTLEGPDLLRGPEAAGGVAVATHPPRAYVRTFKDLSDGGKGTLWSGWGDGCLAGGRYSLAIGNHLDLAAGRGESRVYEFDPATRALRLAVNVRDVIPDAKYAGGKVHARLEPAPDGWLCFATYWGKVPKQADFDAGFQGSVLLRYRPSSGHVESLGVPVPGQGLPASHLDPDRMLLYFYAVYSGDLVVYDLARREVKHRGSGDVQAGGRCLMRDAAGNVYFSTKDGRLARYSPQANAVEVTDARLPGDAAKEEHTLRAAAPVTKQGLLYAMTKAGRLFAFNPPRGTVTDLGPNFGARGEYTAAMVLSPDERYLYYAPGAHGSGARIGVPVVQYDLAARRQKVLAFLGPGLRERFRYIMGGTFNLQVSPDGGTLYGTFNGATLEFGVKKEETFGRPALVVLDIPATERE